MNAEVKRAAADDFCFIIDSIFSKRCACDSIALFTLPDLPPLLAKAAVNTSRLRIHLALLRCWPMTPPTFVPSTTSQ